ncbi:MAG: metallophosphoesterase [Pyrinomonadaceae bacterium]|nr:metallophosphoesterase [Pyrinomonadaceae bacterium]
MTYPNQPFFTLAQISDLHFIGKLTEKGRTHYLKQFGTKSHAFNKVDALSRAFRLIQHPRWGKPIEVLMATGDISTDGSTKALYTALTFIECQAITDVNGKPLATGLNKQHHQRLVLPGNHDRYTATWLPKQVSSKELENIFSTPVKYPYVRGYRPSGSTNKSDPTLLFIVFDSTLDPTDPAFAWNRVARGRVEETECQGMLDALNNIKSTREVESIDGGKLEVNYDKTFRIVLLHHHPKRHGRGLRAAVKHATSKMENARLFIRYCFDAHIDLILFGHQHKEYYDIISPTATPDWSPPSDAHDIYYFCCLSTSEYSETDNGFYLIDFYKNEFRVTPYHWTGASFIDQAFISRPYTRPTF